MDVLNCLSVQILTRHSVSYAIGTSAYLGLSMSTLNIFVDVSHPQAHLIILNPIEYFYSDSHKISDHPQLIACVLSYSLDTLSIISAFISILDHLLSSQHWLEYQLQWILHCWPTSAEYE